MPVNNGFMATGLLSQSANAGFWKQNGPKIAVALILTLASGLVDIVGYLSFYHLFTAHLTGTTVQLGRSIVGQNHTDALAALTILLCFFAGSVFGRIAIETGSRRRLRSVASVTLAIEAAMLLIVTYTAGPLFGAKGPLSPFWAIALLAAAMGVQTATLTGIGPLTVHTTFVTGMINKLAQLISHIFFRTYDLLGRGSNQDGLRDNRYQDVQQSLFLFAIWITYVAGAVFGTWFHGLWGVRSLFVAVGMLFVGIVTDQFRPLSIQEEKEQSED